MALLPIMSNVQPVLLQGTIPTYTATLLDFTPVAAATDILALIGVTGKKITLTLVEISCASSANTYYGFQLFKRSTLNSGGTPTGVTAVANDSGDPVSAATLTQYATNPTLGTGTLMRSSHVTSVGTASTTLSVIPISWVYNNRSTKPPILMSANESYCISGGGIAVPTGMKVRISLEWTEE